MPENIELILKKLELSDAPEMFQLFSDKTAVQMTNWPHLTTLEESTKKIEQIIQRYSSNPLHFGPLIIRLKEGQFVGVMGADAQDSSNGIYEAWYFLHRLYWGRGLATQAVKQLLELLVASGRVKNVKATAVVENVASWRLLEKHGFKRKGVIAGGHTKHGQNLDLYEYHRV
jgi:ribosomal-protein-alanine N-acetyltransferase